MRQGASVGQTVDRRESVIQGHSLASRNANLNIHIYI